MAFASEKPLRRISARPMRVSETAVRLRLLSVLVLFATSLLVVIAVAGVVIARNLAMRPSPVSAPIAAEAPKVDPDAKRDVPAAKNAPIVAAPAVAEKPATPPITTILPLPGFAPTPKTSIQTTKLLESIGGLCAVQLYQSYLNVGLLADAVEHETYPKAEAIQILGTIVTLSQTVDGQIRKVQSAGLEKDDVDSLERVRKASALVRNQAASLQSFWENGEKEHIESYRMSRAQCWQELQSILGLPAE
jgi:hypothetical protein